jgi:hypothetical protein
MMNKKVEHVRRAARQQARPHTCHWPGCTQQVPPALWGCSRHWFSLPLQLRARLWRAYRVGQEYGAADVSPEYLQVAQEIQQWIRDHGTSIVQ